MNFFIKNIITLAILFNVFCNVQASDQWEETKRDLGIINLVLSVKHAQGESVISKKIIQNQAKLATQIKIQELNAANLSDAINNLNKKIDSYSWSKEFRASGENPTAKTLKAIKTMEKNLSSMKARQYSNILHQKKLDIKKQELRGQKVKLDVKLKTSHNTWKLSGKKQAGLVKPSKAMKSLGFLGFAATAVDIATEVKQIDARISKGSTKTLENLNIALKSVEAFQPTLPFFKTPSDVSREIITYQAALKERNKSLLKGNEINHNGTYEFVNGGASIESYIFRKLQKSSMSFDANNFEESVKEAYKVAREDYMKNNFSVFLGQLYETKEMLLKEKNSSWLSVSKELFQSLINGIDFNIKSLLEESSKIWDEDKGLGMVMDLASTSAIKNLVEQNKKIATLLIETDKLQSKQAQQLADEAKKFEISLINANSMLQKMDKKESIAKANTQLAKISSIAIVQSGSSHIGSASFGYQILNKKYKQQSKTLYKANYKDTTGQPSIPSLASLAPQKFSESQWVMTEGTPIKHFSTSSSYGSIKPLQGNTIYAVNNADVAQTSIQKNFLVPNNVNTANISSIVKFVTTEYPGFVGSEFNDIGKITITTPGGKNINIKLLNSSVNGSSFTQATGMPAPLSGLNPNNGAGQTVWSSSTKFIPVAPGGTLKVKVDVINVGDTAYPSAVLINKLEVK